MRKTNMISVAFLTFAVAAFMVPTWNELELIGGLLPKDMAYDVAKAHQSRSMMKALLDESEKNLSRALAANKLFRRAVSQQEIDRLKADIAVLEVQYQQAHRKWLESIGVELPADRVFIKIKYLSRKEFGIIKKQFPKDILEAEIDGGLYYLMTPKAYKRYMKVLILDHLEK